MISTLKLCLVTHIHGCSFSSYLKLIQQAVSGGVTSIQLRDKNSSSSDLYHRARILKSILQPLSVPLIVNDSVKLAYDVDAEGVHLGQSDASPIFAREYLGPKKLIGLSVESFSDLDYANTLDCLDYIAASAVFPSLTKTDCKTVWHLEGLKTLVNASRHPVVAIGGINTSNLQSVLEQGAYGVAVVSAVHQARDYQQAASALRRVIDEHHEPR
ncbi:thiamine phosphate synthase [Legionella oakridgensis]|uniref:Thiamine-phosphate synthase n=2 Tax=Legionella oakridgensis TaxID=29423 RepID=W0B911_9GAMM|nr:thiamine phosphate synthase [Legionella oakridgensis]AHE67033.1 thiamine-phosphate pyrophosphorylase [Legionella oakridgensis ATCC 33761 = DSM 21215]ETO93319.1 thiamine-phosphate diphosphorylase [Legionella oakridgensis RV-2-2007]KTD37184.1 phosphomethylpyrimidine kinase/thiamin-phosphate pyrophosphorylase [Legionella oakridgensis]